ncbi:MAG: DUF4397 domain-containing protein, partial [Sphingobacteriales bacterium]
MKLKHYLGVALVALMVSGLSGCLKSTPIEPPKPVAYMAVINTSFRAPAVEMLFGTEKKTPPINPGAYFNRYSTIDPGPISVTFKKAGADSLVAGLPAGDYYDSSTFSTLLVYDNPSGTGALAARISDQFPKLDASRAFIRFWQLSNDAQNVDLYLESTKVFPMRSPADNITNPSYNAFQPYTAGNYSLKAKVAGTDSTLATTTVS